MGACYAFLLVVVVIGPERMNHDVILRDRHKDHHSRTDEEEKRDITPPDVFDARSKGE